MAPLGKRGWKWIGGAGALLLAGAGLFLIALQVLPWLLQPRIVKELESRGIEVGAFPLESTGMGSSRVGPGALAYGPQGLEWESVTVTYRPTGLLAGNLDSLLVESPSLALDVRLPRPAAGVPVPKPSAEPVPERPDPDPPAPLPEQRPPPADKEARPSTGTPDSVAEKPIPIKPMDIHSMLADIPFGEMRIDNGSIALSLPSGTVQRFAMESHFQKAAGRLTGELNLDGEMLEARTSIRSLEAERLLTVQVAAELEPSLILEEAAETARSLGRNIDLPDIRFESAWKADLLAEFEGPGPPQASGELAISAFRMDFPGLEGTVRMESGLLLGTYRAGRLDLTGALRTGAFTGNGLRLSGFGLRMGFLTGEGADLESDVIEFHYKGWSGLGALRGTATPVGADEAAAVRMEAAFSTIAGPLFSIAPASLLLESDAGAYRISASELGIDRMTTIWIEELSARVDPAMRTLEAGFTWFNGLGTRMGRVRFEAATGSDASLRSRFYLEEEVGQPFLSGRLTEANETLEITLDGTLPNAWINAIRHWWGDTPGEVSGAPAAIAADLSGPSYFLKGSVDILLDGLVFTMPDGPAFRGISGNLRFLFNGLPRSDGSAVLRIDSITTGNVVLSGLEARWSLPTLRTLRVETVTASLAEGGVRVQPFTVDPLDPEIRTQIHFDGLDGDAFLGWLGEERFSIQGAVSGSVQVVWRDGQLYIGDGKLGMDRAEVDKRFRFEDADFLKDRFKAMQGIPAELRDPLLDTLLKEGIRIDELTLGILPLPESGEVSLRLEVTGEAKSETIEVPIRGLVINNVISEDDLGRLLGLVGPVLFLSQP